jgi:hypothetical protein
MYGTSVSGSDAFSPSTVGATAEAFRNETYTPRVKLTTRKKGHREPTSLIRETERLVGSSKHSPEPQTRERNGQLMHADSSPLLHRETQWDAECGLLSNAVVLMPELVATLRCICRDRKTAANFRIALQIGESNAKPLREPNEGVRPSAVCGSVCFRLSFRRKWAGLRQDHSHAGCPRRSKHGYERLDGKRCRNRYRGSDAETVEIAIS